MPEKYWVLSWDGAGGWPVGAMAPLVILKKKKKTMFIW